MGKGTLSEGAADKGLKLKMKSILASSLVFVWLLTGCERESAPTHEPPPTTPSAPKAKEKVRLEISEMGIDEQGYLQVQVKNNTSVPLNLINISWFFYDKDGNPIKDKDLPEYDQTIITTAVKDNSDSMIVGHGESKVFYNPLITVYHTFGDSLTDVGYAQIKIYINESEFENLNLDANVSTNDASIHQIFDSPRFPLQKVTALTTGSTSKQQILDSAIQKAHEGHFSEMTFQEMDAFRESRLLAAKENDQTIKSRQEAARNQFPQKERDVYQYMKDRFGTIAASPSGYDPDRDDPTVVSDAVAKFGISKENATDIYFKLDAAGLDLK